MPPRRSQRGANQYTATHGRRRAEIVDVEVVAFAFAHPEWAAHGFTNADMREWGPIPSAVAVDWARHGFSPDDHRSWTQTLVPVTFTSGALDPSEARVWDDHGFGPSDTFRWIEGGFDPVSASEWIDAGVDVPETARRLVDDHDLSPDSPDAEIDRAVDLLARQTQRRRRR